MRPATRDLIRDVATRHGVEPDDILSHRRPKRLLGARIEIARALAQRGYNGPQIGAVLKRDYTTVYYYLGRLGDRQPRPRPPPPPKPINPRPSARREPVPYAGREHR